jgi:hypothetical protein
LAGVRGNRGHRDIPSNRTPSSAGRANLRDMKPTGRGFWRWTHSSHGQQSREYHVYVAGEKESHVYQGMLSTANRSNLMGVRIIVSFWTRN